METRRTIADDGANLVCRASVASLPAVKALLAFGTLLALGCAHVPKSTGAPGVKSTAETLLERTRWKDFRGVAELVIAERRTAFEEARKRFDDAKNLNITDY